MYIYVYVIMVFSVNWTYLIKLGFGVLELGLKELKWIRVKEWANYLAHGWFVVLAK